MRARPCYHNSGRSRNCESDHSGIFIEPNGAIGKFCSGDSGNPFPLFLDVVTQDHYKASICMNRSVQQLAPKHPCIKRIQFFAFCAAHLFLCAAAIFARASFDSFRLLFFFGVGIVAGLSLALR
jgi:hypothetical protein